MKKSYRIFWEVEGILTITGDDEKVLNEMAENHSCPLMIDTELRNVKSEFVGYDETENP
jgi:hypothetical protein